MVNAVKKSHTDRPAYTALLYGIVGTSIILIACMFIAVLFKETILQQEWSKSIPAILVALLPISTLVCLPLTWYFAHANHLWSYYGFILSMLLGCAASGLTVKPHTLQLVIFVIIGILIGSLVFLVPGVIQNNRQLSIRARAAQLAKRDYLVRLWTRYTIQARYSQKVLGIGWVMLFPLMEAIVLGFAFSVLMGRGYIAGKPFVIFLLSGIILFNLFSRVVQHSTISLLSSSGIISQIYFPREIILLVLMGEELINFIFTFITLIIVNAFSSTFPTVQYLLLVLPIIIMTAIAFGTSLFASFGNIVFQDLQQLIALLMRLLFYATVLFSLRIATPETAIFGLVNPLTALVEFFRAIIFYEQAPQFVVLVWPALLAAALVYSGYIFFTHNEDHIIDYV
jgi:lipopolysaccharide transport system permease protein